MGMEDSIPSMAKSKIDLDAEAFAEDFRKLWRQALNLKTEAEKDVEHLLGTPQNSAAQLESKRLAIRNWLGEPFVPSVVRRIILQDGRGRQITRSDQVKDLPEDPKEIKQLAISPTTL